jgi:ELP3 family radical SAM enzyme/protein acetyltransferase
MSNITDIEDIKYNTNHLLLHDLDKDNIIINNLVIDLVKELEKLDNINQKKWMIINQELKKKHKIVPGILTMNYYYMLNVSNNIIKPNKFYEEYNIRKQSRTNSGITQVTVMMTGYPNGERFSCQHNCYYCPDEPAHEGNNWTPQPRSYLYDEPAVHRANMNKFDAANQMWDRMSSLQLCGLPIDKIELMASGGTFGSYPLDYRIEFTRDLYYAANTFYINKDERRERYSLEEEILINMNADVRIIGYTLETRPDHITPDEIKLFRQLNCTRIQIGVQHTDDNILKKVNRGCYYKDAVLAIKNLLNNGLKVDVHLMFDLPFAEAEDDIKMINKLYVYDEKTNEYTFADSNLTFDQAKYYPFSSVNWTVTKQWEDRGECLHYSQDELINVLIYAKSHTPHTIRLNRVIRDIPSHYIHAGNDIPNLRQLLEIKMKRINKKCNCIRCREVKSNKDALECIDNSIVNIRKYKASNGIEYFISIESQDKKYIYGFCRLRLSNKIGYFINKYNEEEILFPYLNGCAMIRELHVYGNMIPVNENSSNNVQHRGFGKKLVNIAENIASDYGFNKIAIISGVGVRQYYHKLGYELVDTYMIKELYKNQHSTLFYNIIIITIILLFSFFLKIY